MIEVRDLTKRYGDNLAVDGLSFFVEKGSVCGFLGPNGAGKTTTLSVMTGCLAATAGTVLIDGLDIFEQPIEAKRKIGYLPELPPLYPDMTPLEYLRFAAELKGIGRREIPKQVFSAVETTGIGSVSRRLIKFLSKGFKQRVGLAAALLGEPEVLILDEPTVGLDPKQIAEIRAVIRGYGAEHTVIFSTHILSEVQNICDRVVIISEGRLVACDKPSNLAINDTSDRTLRLVVNADRSRVKKALSGSSKIKAVQYNQLNDGGLELLITPKGGEDIRAGVSKALVNSGCTILSMEQTAVSLEDVFLRLTSKEDER